MTCEDSCKSGFPIISRLLYPLSYDRCEHLNRPALQCLQEDSYMRSLRKADS